MRRRILFAVLLFSLVAFACADDDDDDRSDEITYRQYDCRRRSCRPGYTCDTFTGRCVQNYPDCVRRCPRNYHCELETVFCIRAPCPPQQVCVRGLRCPGGRCVDLDRSFLCLPPGQ